jgi:hypothetical protein
VFSLEFKMHADVAAMAAAGHSFAAGRNQEDNPPVVGRNRKEGFQRAGSNRQGRVFVKDAEHSLSFLA